MIHIIISGKNCEVEANTTVAQLLKDKNVEMPEYVSVSVNEEILPRERYDSYLLKERDEVEFLYFMGGGGT